MGGIGRSPPSTITRASFESLALMSDQRKIFVDLLSQPARALTVFCRACNLGIEEVTTDIGKEEHLTPEYKAANPLGKIPCYVEPGFHLGESAAIMKYLIATNHVSDHWYPGEPRKRAIIDSAIDWHHNNVRRGSHTMILSRVFYPMRGAPIDQKAIADAEAILTAALQMLEDYWLRGSNFLAGDEMSIADLLMVTELDMLHILDCNPQGTSRQDLIGNFRKVQTWMEHVAQACQPHHAEVSKPLMEAAKNWPRR